MRGTRMLGQDGRKEYRGGIVEGGKGLLFCRKEAKDFFVAVADLSGGVLAQPAMIAL
jgi:hypothetical protein